MHSFHLTPFDQSDSFDSFDSYDSFASFGAFDSSDLFDSFNSFDSFDPFYVFFNLTLFDGLVVWGGAFPAKAERECSNSYRRQPACV